jgi:hypothetical protein
MSISTTEKSKKSDLYRERMATLREFHQSTLDHIGESSAYFYPKMAYKPIGLEETCVGFFPSELRKGTAIYTEFVSREYESEDHERTLWKYEFNPHWEEEYPKGETSTGSEIYYVPVNELMKIPRVSRSTVNVKVVDSLDEILPSNSDKLLVQILEKINANLELIAKRLK